MRCKLEDLEGPKSKTSAKPNKKKRGIVGKTGGESGFIAEYISANKRKNHARSIRLTDDQLEYVEDLMEQVRASGSKATESGILTTIISDAIDKMILDQRNV